MIKLPKDYRSTTEETNIYINKNSITAILTEVGHGKSKKYTIKVATNVIFIMHDVCIKDFTFTLEYYTKKESEKALNYILKQMGKL
jgi:hypothetical protein